MEKLKMEKMENGENGKLDHQCININFPFTFFIFTCQS
jgi:hypothetical protein